MNEGLTGREVYQLQHLLLKANDEQVDFISRQVEDEQLKRTLRRD